MNVLLQVSSEYKDRLDKSLERLSSHEAVINQHFNNYNVVIEKLNETHQSIQRRADQIIQQIQVR